MELALPFPDKEKIETDREGDMLLCFFEDKHLRLLTTQGRGGKCHG